MNLIDWLCILVISSKYCFGQNYKLPHVTLKAFEPAGLEVSIPADALIRTVGFHANINQEIDSTEPGEIAGDVNVDPTKSLSDITYSNPNVKIKAGDTVYYWIYVQHNFLGYRFPGKWVVTDLEKSSTEPCNQSVSKISTQEIVCKNAVLFDDNFNTNAIRNKWITEQYFPSAPDYEFVVYKKDKDVVFIKNGLLVIKPKLITDWVELNKDVVNISDGCTRTIDRCQNTKFVIQKPVIAGRIISNFSVQYGDIEIRAKLPFGDWVYPQLYLEGENNQKIVLAYARGNDHLTGNDDADIGGRLLFAGPVLSEREPERSSKLNSYRAQKHFGNEFHVYRLRWTPDIMEFYIDNAKFGHTNAEAIKNSLLSKKNLKLVIGVGVGGVTDFPDFYKSGESEKPWRNFARNQVLDFYNSKDSWFKSWGENCQLEVDYVRIKSI